MLAFGTENEEVNQFSRLSPFVLSVEDDADNQLRIVIALPADTEAPEYVDPRLAAILADAKKVDADLDRLYEIWFETYILYQCRNESYTAFDPHEVIRGKHLVIYEKSPLLDFYQNIICDIDYDHEKAERKHYGILAENHILDILANEPPVITRITADP